MTDETPKEPEPAGSTPPALPSPESAPAPKKKEKVQVPAKPAGVGDELKRNDANVSEYYYNTLTLNQVFVLSSFVLLVSIVWMVVQDYNREWKVIQRQARVMDQNRTRTALDTEKVKTQLRLDGARRTLAEAQQLVASRVEGIALAEQVVDRAEREQFTADTDFKNQKSVWEAARYRFEHAVLERAAGRADDAHVKEETEYFDGVEKSLHELEALAVHAETALAEAVAGVDKLRQEQTEAQKAVEDITREQDRLERKLAGLQETIATRMLDAPLMDFVAPTIKVQQVVLPGIRDNYNFAVVAKVDRCMSCHVNIDKAGYEHEENPLRTHPRLDLIMGGSSPHPMEKVGCTVCHQGSGQALDFVHAVHTPRNAEQAEEWEKKYHWDRFEYWDWPMLPTRYTEASCAKCHQGVSRVPQAVKLNQGRELYERAGCFGCHKTLGFEPEQFVELTRKARKDWVRDNRTDLPLETRLALTDEQIDELTAGFADQLRQSDAFRLRKVGPDLRRVAVKLDPAWIGKWLRDPKHFRPSTRMPRFWKRWNPQTGAYEGLPNVGVDTANHVDYLERGETEMAAVAQYLVGASKVFVSKDRFELEPVPAREGRVEEGRRLFEGRGCLGCHSMERENWTFNVFAPDLSNIGSKVNIRWLHDWLKNPRHYFPRTRMGDMRLSEEEIQHLSAYLLSLKDATWEAIQTPQVNEQILHDIGVKEYLSLTETQERAEAEWASWTAQKRAQFVGERMVQRYGCYGCHTIEGFQGQVGVGAELTVEGSKAVDKLDFGFERIPVTRWDWFELKLREPRIFDRIDANTQRKKTPQEKLKMPQFGFSETPDAHGMSEIDYLVTFLLSQTDDNIDLEQKRRLTPAESDQERGRFVIRQYNCIGCHVVGLDPVPVEVAGKVREAQENPASGNTEWWTAQAVGYHGEGVLPAGRFLRGQLTDAHTGAFYASVWEGLAKWGQESPPEVLDPKTYSIPYVVAYGVGEGRIVAHYMGRKSDEGEDLDLRYKAPPVLYREGAKIQPDWFFKFLTEPFTMRAWIDLRMPTFHMNDTEIRAVVEYFSIAASEPYPFVNRELRKADPVYLHKVNLEEFGVDGTPQYKDAYQCARCHPLFGKTPGGTPDQWGIDFKHASTRLKPEWIADWLRDPAGYIPGTKMPSMFGAFNNKEERIQRIVDLLMNMQKVYGEGTE